MILWIALNIALSFANISCEEQIKTVSSPVVAALATVLADGRVTANEITEINRTLNQLPQLNRVSTKSYDLNSAHDVLHFKAATGLKQNVAFNQNEQDNESDLNIQRDEKGFEISYQNKTYRFVNSINTCALDTVTKINNKTFTVLKDASICRDLSSYFNLPSPVKMSRLKIMIRERLSILKRPGQIAFFGSPNSDQMNNDELNELYKKELQKCQTKKDFFDWQTSNPSQFLKSKENSSPSSTP